MLDYNRSSMRYEQELSMNPEMAHRKILSRIKPASKVLEFGSSAGVMTRAMTQGLNCRVSIVEIDPEAYGQARQFAQDGICSDIESFEWEGQFAEGSFDYILFVDVLEHLRNSVDVLAHCRKFLKEDGAILISVPNMAHNSVIIQLLQNQIIYKSTGILDYTHVHYFTFSELQKMCNEAGYRPVYLDATYIAVGKNEFDISYKDIDAIMAGYLRKRPFGEVYQYIAEIKKEDYVLNNDLPLENCLDSPAGSYTNVMQAVTKITSEEITSVRALTDRLISIAPEEIFRSNNEIARLRNEINDIYTAYPALEDNTELVKQNFSYQEEVREKNNHINLLQNEIETLGSRIRALENEREEKSKHVEFLSNYFNEVEAQREALEKELTESKERKNKAIKENEALTLTITGLQQEIKNRDGHIEQLLEKERKFDQIWNSRGVRICRFFWDLKDKMFPQGSRRRLVMKFVKKFVTHPIRMLKKCTPSRIKRTIEYMKTEDVSMIERRLDLSAAKVDGEQDEIERIPLDLFPAIDAKITSFSGLDHISLPAYAAPRVSIVIPVYNQFSYTYNCIRSIKKNTGDIPYEVILADDCSTDLTRNISEIVDNLIICKTEQNCRFLLNCNNAAKRARGEFIFFLNNDTQVQEGWLDTLVSLMDRDPGIGMSGSMLLYPDGALQEAGGIIWKDASAWNYGRQRGPKEPEFNYVRETDYISGAAILIRRSLWEEIGGFDERYAPAYCEDSDLAFEVRKHGYKVVYQPLSKVVHFEGVSNGTDVTTGLKAYQVANNKKFYEKWKDVLNKENFENGTEVFLAKDRSRFKKHILVVDHYVPMHDKDAGGKTSFMYIELFTKMGLKVTFIGDNFYPHEPYTTELNQLGVEVLYGNYYHDHWEEWLRENGKCFTYVYLQRPHISIKYIDIVRKYTKAKIFYFAHDLHYLREYREYQLTGDEEKKKSSEHWKKIEYELFDKADVVHVVGSYEEGVLLKELPGKVIRNIPSYMYDHLPEGIIKDFKERKDILYVGGFGHPPNIDAVLWFGKTVFPKVLEKYPDVKWYVVGAKAPDEIKAMASDNIIIWGFATDEELENLYRNCRLDVAPVRFGAGVKGKVVESAYYQIPLVTTDIGGEGLDTTVGNMIIENDADGMADAIISVYEDWDRLKKMSDAGIEFINNNFTEEIAENVIRQDMDL